ncbi:MAG: hypothetical protein E6G03_15865 [Actinobacteria bacterium]|nr:MAG: hypothetical protein E6G03_15865 [Actinomycetota bacterium]
MTLTLSPPVRYAALLGLLAAVLIGAGMTMLGHGGSTAATTHVIKHHPFGPGLKHAAGTIPKKHAATTTHPAAATKAKGAQAAPRVAAPAQPSAAERAALAAGLPAAVARALGQHGVVVVSLYNPYSQVDGIAFAEARAGARLAGVGFVPLNVLSQAQVEKLTEQLGLLPDPGLLVYTRPAALVARISGFADKETVAQAAQNAARTGS